MVRFVGGHKVRRRFVLQAVLAILLICQRSICFGKEAPAPTDPNRYLNAVRTFADNVLKYGRDTYGPKHTPLFVDGLNINTHEPVKWRHDNEVWILSNLASHQNLFRVLVALTTITGDPRYKQAAMKAIEYAFENLRSLNGLLHWGGHVAYDALADEKCMEANVHELEHHYPYYELMWQVDPVATRQAIEAFWSTHILDWSNLEMNRHGPMGSKLLANLWRQEYKGGPVFFAGRGVPFLVAGSDLSYAGAMLFRLSGSTEPLIWSKRLAHRYIETRSPKIGISATLYHKTRSQEVPLKVQLGDDFKGHLLEDGMEFPSYGYWVQVSPWICDLLLGEMLDANGSEFTQWAKEELTAWGKVAYRKKDNSWIPMLIDGTNLEGYVCKRDGPLGPKGTRVVAQQAGPSQFWAYAEACRVTGDGLMWEMARNIAQGSNLGDIGETPSSEPRLEMDIALADPTILLGFLELFKKTEKKAYLRMAEKIGNNILSTCFNKGFFTYSNKHLYAKFDFVAPLALLHLDRSLQAREWNIPEVWPSDSYFHCPYDGFGRTYDNLVIYSRTEENHLDFELFEAVHSGDTKKFAGLISSGADINATKGSFWSDTLLHSAVRVGDKNIIELLIQKGADVNKTNKDGETPLYYAALSGHKDIAELLIEKGAKISTIHLAAYTGDIAEVKAFIQEGIDINALDKRNMTALHFAARGDQTDTAELLIARGAKVDVGSWTPLYVAVEANNIDIAEYLIAHGANVNSGEGVWTPLQEAAYHSKEMVELLLANGANINAGGWTALHSALDDERFDIVELLLDKGADVNIEDDSGYAPLHIAASYAAKHNPKVVELLISKGADINAKDNDGKTALAYAVEKAHTEIAKILRKHGAKEEEGKEAPQSAPAPKEDTEVDPNTLELNDYDAGDLSSKETQGLTPPSQIPTVFTVFVLGLLGVLSMLYGTSQPQELATQQGSLEWLQIGRFS